MMGYYGYGPMMGYEYGGGAWWGWIIMALFWAIIIAVVVMIVRRLGHGHRRWHEGHGDSAIEILKERYAKGEIDKKEFEEKKKDLEV